MSAIGLSDERMNGKIRSMLPAVDKNVCFHRVTLAVQVNQSYAEIRVLPNIP